MVQPPNTPKLDSGTIQGLADIAKRLDHLSSGLVRVGETVSSITLPHDLVDTVMAATLRHPVRIPELRIPVDGIPRIAVSLDTRALADVGQTVVSAMAPLIQINDVLSKVLRTAFPTALAGYGELVRSVFDWLQRHEATLDEMEESDFPYIWLGSAPVHVVMELYLAYRQDRLHDAMQDIVDYVGSYDTHRRFVSSLRDCPALEGSRPIVKDALWAHRHKKYTLSIPALLSQIEAGARRMTGRHARRGHDTRKNRSHVFKDLRRNFPRFTPFLDFLEHKHFIHTRNPILHGNELSYASETLSVECILALNELANLSGGGSLFYDS